MVANNLFYDKFIYENELTISGLNFSLIGFYINYLSKNRDVLVVTKGLYEANNYFKSVSNLNKNTLFFPMDDFASLLAISSSPDLKINRINTLNNIKKKNNIVITNLAGYLKKLDKSINKFEINKSIKRKDLLDFLDSNNFNKTNIVVTTGEYAVRNYIIDVFPINSSFPIRLEFFGDDLESIRLFNFETQISFDKLDNYLLESFSDCSSNNYETIVNKLNNPIVVFIDYLDLCNYYNDIKNNINLSDMFINFDYSYSNCLYVNTLDDINIKGKIIKYDSKNIESFNNDIDKLYKFVVDNKNIKNVVFCISNDYIRNKIINLFGNDIILNDVKSNKISLFNLSINNGFIFDNYIFISDNDINGKENKINYINHYVVGRKIRGFEDLTKGDYVVHSLYGIGQYNGLVTLENKGVKKDYLLINYNGNDKIYVPLLNIDKIYKYADKDIKNPVLNSLNSSLWVKTKAKVQKKVEDISKELISLYAKRSTLKCDRYFEMPEELIFANEFEYEETEDQKKAINDILNDLSSDRPMDRLLCGDVGFGKTEVALRAIYRTVLNNKQVLYLCPTTVLSKQQYNTMLKRFYNFGVNVELINRFTTTKKYNDILKRLEEGKIDVLVSTHRGLNKKIKYKNLGLLIIDEEQRFGVKHKEIIKELKENINILTLSATPIPRTLKMAMSGMKDMSIIDTAPINRYPVQTYVIPENDYLLKDAIYKELSRDGQVYILINNIENLNNEFNKIISLVPEARVCIAHGRMAKDELDEVFTSFVDKKYDILFCTTIIETGIDIPNVNTLIVIDADKFGLSQLYQIRGRVGRSDRIAYAFMMYDKSKMLNDIAIKRLQTIKEFTELGSGYKIAMRDLSIRGAGELLGSSQSGYISSVGIDFYMDLINQEVNRIKGVKLEEDIVDDVQLLNVSTTVSSDYVDDESIRIEIHKLINSINSYESFNLVKNEIEDRFGKVNSELLNYMYEEWFQNEAKNLDITNIKYVGKNIDIELPENISSSIDGEKLFMQIYSINNKFRLKYVNKRIIISLNIMYKENDYVKDLLDLLLLIKNCIKN